MALRTAGHTSDGPAPGGSYSPSVRLGRFVAVSRQCGYLSDRTLVDGLEAQTELALDNLRRALETYGASMDSVLSVDVHLTNVEDFAAFDAVYAKAFNPPFPARSTVYCGLKPGVLGEISAMATERE